MTRIRKTSCVLLAVLLLFVSGCGGTSPDEYCQTIQTEVDTLLRSLNHIVDDAKMNKFNEYDLETAERAFSKMESLEPPKGYEDLHKELCDGISKYREMLTTIKEAYALWEKKDPANNSLLKEKYKKIEELSSDATFPEAVKKIAIKYRNG